MAVLECDLTNRVRDLLGQKYKVFEEIALFNRSIDMVLVDESAVLTVEFKIRDWRKAIVQIKGHLVATDYAYLCMPKKRISQELVGLLKQNGIGLWLYDWSANHLIEQIRARKSAVQWNFYRDLLIARTVERSKSL